MTLPTASNLAEAMKQADDLAAEFRNARNGREEDSSRIKAEMSEQIAEEIRALNFCDRSDASAAATRIAHTTTKIAQFKTMFPGPHIALGQAPWDAPGADERWDGIAALIATS